MGWLIWKWNHEFKLPISMLYLSLFICSSADPLICNLRNLQYLDLSNNQLSGSIPSCLGNLSGNLVVLNLQKNNFDGMIPQTFDGGSLRTLDLSYNRLQGALPPSLSTCKSLEVVNVGHNSLVDVFPSWAEHLPNLKVLDLQYNKFHGSVPDPTDPSSFFNLHIIDLSHNEFSGRLPSKSFESWHSMIMPDNISESGYLGSPYYSDTVIIMNKGLEMVLKRILIIYKAVDFSYNRFHGEIPMSIGRFQSLRTLNLSGNALTGHIPLSLANLTNLESLDLSHNQLSGEIPNQLTRLTFLEVLDLSYNNLTGLIPRGGQFDTFDNAFKGNPGLFWSPLAKNNPEPYPAFPDSPSSQSQIAGWQTVLMGYGCGVVFGLVWGNCLLWRKDEWIISFFNVRVKQQRRTGSNKAMKQHSERWRWSWS